MAALPLGQAPGRRSVLATAPVLDLRMARVNSELVSKRAKPRLNRFGPIMEVIVASSFHSRMKLTNSKLAIIWCFDWMFCVNNWFVAVSTCWNSHERKCSSNSSSYCKGMRAGLDSIVKEKERICLEDSPDECIALGEAAAQGKKALRWRYLSDIW